VSTARSRIQLLHDSDAQGTLYPTERTYTANDQSYEIFGTSAYFNGYIYLGVTPTSTSAPGVVRRFSYAPGGLTAEDFTPLSVPQDSANTPRTTPFISANGTSDGILWTIDQGQPLQSPQATTTAILYAYDATNLGNELYSKQHHPADQPGIGIKFTSPIVVQLARSTSPLGTIRNRSPPAGRNRCLCLK